MRDKVTPTGRGTEVYKTGQLWGWRAIGTGPQPPDAAGLYTSITRAMKARDEYLERFWKQAEAKQKK